MIVPQFWAESRLQHRDKGRQVTLRRFGWSDASQDDAQAMADARVAEAMARVLAGERLPQSEPKIPYNGAAGMPIREEIVGRHGATVITRNSYGARCLNTADVLFADVDFPQASSLRLDFAVFGLLMLAAVAVAWLTHSRGLGIAFGVVSLFFITTISGAIFRAVQRASGGADRQARRRIARHLARHPDWNLRLYRTPAGLRVVATHRPFAADDPAVAEFFATLAADPVYVAMCRNQQCFRARVSAKPWRIGIESHLRPRPGVWPVAPERRPERDAWIALYDAAASAYAACAFVEELGSGVSDPAVLAVVDLHDDLSAATSGRPIA